MQAHLLALNEFGMPKVLKDTDAMYTKIIYLILLEKGKFQSHPNMGVGLRSRYRYNNEQNLLAHLRNDISDQISKYLPELEIIDITTKISQEHVLTIMIDTSKGVYLLNYNTNEDQMYVGDTYSLNDL